MTIGHSLPKNKFVPFDAHGNFRSTSGGIRKLAVRGAGNTIFSSGVTLGVQIMATLVLARLLTPSDFGVVAMVTTFSLLLTNFGLNGFTDAILQQENLNHGLTSNLFWINLGMGALLSIGFAASGTLLARLYRNPTVAHVAVGVALSIVVTSTSVFHLALLKRAMRFGVVSANDIVAKFVAVVVSIVLGVAGWGYWALVAGTIALPLSQSVGAWYLCRWMPGVPRRVRGTGSMLRFAMSVYSRFGINYLARNMDNLLVGWRFGAYSLGFYKRAYDLFALPASQIAAPLNNVAVSALSRFRGDVVQYRRHIMAAIALMALVGMGIGADLTLTGRDVIRLVLGAKWDEAGRIFRFFGPGIGIMLVYYMQSSIHLSIGQAERWLRWSIFESVFTGLLFVVALPWGPAGIAFAWTASFWILLVPGFWYAARPIGIGVTPFISAIWKSVAASVAAAGVAAVIIRSHTALASMVGISGAFTRILAVSALFWILYIGAVILLDRGYTSLIQLASVSKEMLPDSLLARLNPASAGDRNADILQQDRPSIVALEKEPEAEVVS